MHTVSSYRDLMRVIAVFNLMNKRHHLVFRGQDADFEPTPTILRDDVMGPTG